MSIEPDPTTSTYATEPSVPPGGVQFGATNGFAIASLVLGIVGLTGFPLIPSVLALIFGYKGKRQIDRSGGAEQGRGLAVAGIVLGWIGTVFLILLGLLFALAIAFSVASSGGVEIFERIRP
ncbi:MAG TPA: DUF4190 domain-containing protein [Actinomycetota bacterium]|nr:DUF4190 domain-containing protein [Actinomycetota bacterium]